MGTIEIDFKKNELIPVITQDKNSGVVLMLAYMNEEAFEETIKTRKVCYYSRSRRRLWRKGEESGNYQNLHNLYYDCDSDTILVKVEQVGKAACHEGYQSCFYREINLENKTSRIIADRIFDPLKVYAEKNR